MRHCALQLTPASFSLLEIAAIDHQFPFDAVAFRAEQLQVLELRLPASGNGNHVIEHQLLPGAAIGAAFTSIGDQLPLPFATVALQRRPLAPFDLGRRRPFWGRVDSLRDESARATSEKSTDIAVPFAALAAVN